MSEATSTTTTSPRLQALELEAVAAATDAALRMWVQALDRGTLSVCTGTAEAMYAEAAARSL